MNIPYVTRSIFSILIQARNGGQAKGERVENELTGSSGPCAVFGLERKKPAIGERTVGETCQRKHGICGVTDNGMTTQHRQTTGDGGVQGNCARQMDLRSDEQG